MGRTRVFEDTDELLNYAAMELSYFKTLCYVK